MKTPNQWSEDDTPMTTKLHPIKHDLPTTLWCGPAALSITTGNPTSVIHQHIIRHTRRRRVKGVSNAVLERVALDLGYQLIPVFDYAKNFICEPKPTLARFLREHRKEISAAPVIVNVTRHYVVVHGRTFVDNQVEVPRPAKKAPGRRRRVFRAWKIVPMEEGV